MAAFLLAIISIPLAIPVAAADYSDGAVFYDIDETANVANVRGYNYEGQATEITIPDAVSYNGKEYPVVGIYQQAFNGTPVQSVKFGSNVTSIGDKAFGFCNSLSTVQLNGALSTIGAEAFYSCSSLRDISFPQGLKSIGNHAFRGSSLQGTVILPASLSEFGIAPFRGCNLSAINVEAGNASLKSSDGVVFTKDGSVLLQYPCGNGISKYQVPDGVKTIAADAMSNAPLLAEAVFPSSLETIGDRAFAFCNLNTITIPANVGTIGSGAFMQNVSIASISTSPSNTAFGTTNGLLINKASAAVIASTRVDGKLVIPEGVGAIDGYVFYGFPELTEVSFPSTLKSTGIVSFANCPKLTKVELGTGIESIGSQTFQECRQLGTVAFPPQLREIGMQAFCYCDGLTEAILNDGLENIGDAVFFMCNGLKKVRVPAGVRQFGFSTFYQCNSLVEAELSEGMTTIPDQMFNMCFNLAHVNIPSTITSIGLSALYGTAITSIDLPEGLETIGMSALYGTQIEEIKLPDSVRELGDYALAWNANMKRIICGSGLKRMGEGCITTMPALESVELNEGLESIGFMGISYCDIMTSLTIPSTVTEIGSWAFAGSPLERLVNKAVTPQALFEGEDIVSNDDGTPRYDSCKLYVPDQSIDAYKAADVWKLFESIQGLSASTDKNNIEKPAPEVIAIYTLDGHRVAHRQPGINILKMSDGTSIKVAGLE